MIEERRRRKLIRVGVDFDGVVTQNPLRAARAIIAGVKHRILGIKKLSFFVPKGKWQKLVYYAGVVAPSLWPAKGIDLLKEMAGSGKYKFVLVTGRYKFVKKQTYDWIKKYNIDKTFEKIYINEEQEQPHDYKKRIIANEAFDYYIEDNWDIVQKLCSSSSTKVFWIYNFLDKGREYSCKFSSLEKALAQIRRENEDIS